MSSSSDAYVVPDVSSGGDVTRLERERLVKLERELLAAQIERDQHVAQLTNELALKSTLLEQAEANAAEATKRAGLEHAQVEQKDAELVKVQAKLDEAQSALQKATPYAADADERGQCACGQIGKYETELTEVRAKLEARESELEAVRLRLMDAEIGWARSKTEADTMRAMTTAGLVNTDEDQIASRLIERMRAMEAEVASLSLRLGEKSLDMIQSRNEG
jgi:chromosome segregation ATPase